MERAAAGRGAWPRGEVAGERREEAQAETLVWWEGSSVEKWPRNRGRERWERKKERKKRQPEHLSVWTQCGTENGRAVSVYLCVCARARVVTVVMHDTVQRASGKNT